MRTFIIMLLICPLFFTFACAEDIYRSAADGMGMSGLEEALPEEAKEVSGSLILNGTYDSYGAIQRLIAKVRDSLYTQLSRLWAPASKIMSLTVLCAAAGNISNDKKIQAYISMAACCSCSLIVTSGIDGIVNLASDALTQLSDYSKAAIPAVFTAAAATGAVVSASAKYAAVCISIEVLISAAQRLIVPLINAYLALVMADSIMDNTLVKTIAKMVKWAATTLMTGITTLFGTYIAMTGLITASTDAVAVKTTKTIISSALPVVGGIISDASGIVLSAASVIKNSAGVFSLIAVCALCAGPFVAITVKMLFFRISSAFASMLPDKRLSGLLSDIGTSMGMLLGLLGCCGIMMFISFMAGIKVVTPA